MRTVDTGPREYGLYWILLAGIIIVAGLLALTELSVLSARKPKLEKLAEDGDSRAQSALRALADQDVVLLALRAGEAAICLAAGGLIFADAGVWLDGKIDWLSFVIAAIVLAGFTQVFALAAHSIDAGSPEASLMRLHWLVKLATYSLIPFARLADAAAAAAFRWSSPPKREEAEADEIEEEVCLLLEQGAQDGVFEKAEQDMVERIFTLDDIRASALMTPRTQIIWLDLDEPPEAHLEILRHSTHSRLPVARGSLDEVVGVVFAKDLLTQFINGQELSLEQHIRSPVFVPKSMSGLRILELFKKSGTHVALVIDEYGGVLGLITINDIVEHIVGDLPLADQPDPAMVVQREDGSWLVDGMLPIDELKQLIDVDELPAEERENFQTAGGFVTSYLERIPTISEWFVWQGWRFEVLDMDRSRIDKLLVSRLAEPDKHS